MSHKEGKCNFWYHNHFLYIIETCINIKFATMDATPPSRRRSNSDGPSTSAPSSLPPQCDVTSLVNELDMRHQLFLGKVCRVCPALTRYCTTVFERDEDAFRRMKRELLQLRRMLTSKNAKYEEMKSRLEALQQQLPQPQGELSVNTSGNLDDMFDMSFDDISDDDISGFFQDIEKDGDQPCGSRDNDTPVKTNKDTVNEGSLDNDTRVKTNDDTVNEEIVTEEEKNADVKEDKEDEEHLD